MQKKILLSFVIVFCLNIGNNIRASSSNDNNYLGFLHPITRKFCKKNPSNDVCKSLGRFLSSIECSTSDKSESTRYKDRSYLSEEIADLFNRHIPQAQPPETIVDCINYTLNKVEIKRSSESDYTKLMPKILQTEISSNQEHTSTQKLMELFYCLNIFRGPEPTEGQKRFCNSSYFGYHIKLKKHTKALLEGGHSKEAIEQCNQENIEILDQSWKAADINQKWQKPTLQRTPNRSYRDHIPCWLNPNETSTNPDDPKFHKRILTEYFYCTQVRNSRSTDVERSYCFFRHYWSHSQDYRLDYDYKTDMPNWRKTTQHIRKAFPKEKPEVLARLIDEYLEGIKKAIKATRNQ